LNLPRHLVLALLRVYRWVLSPAKNALLGSAGCCRYLPSCSAYAIEAVQVHGVCRGGRLAVGLVCRCHPWGGDGVDPVPRLIRT
jgi:putative membrane protein insertion efficiency factor